MGHLGSPSLNMDLIYHANSVALGPSGNFLAHHWFSVNNNLPASVVDTILFNPLGSAAMYAMLFTLIPKISP